MSLGLVGRKCGMTRLFTEEGESIPVSVVQILPNRVTRVLNEQSDGYSAVQVTTGDVKNSRVNKAEAGQFKKAGVEAGRGLWEFRLEEDSDLEVGSDLSLDIFEAGQKN
jgi:large subunit ribosomal protein L3